MCFRCLGDGHLGQFCNRTRVCGIDNCKEVARSILPGGHNRGLGIEKAEESQSVSKRSPRNEGESKDRTSQLNDTYTTVMPPSTAHTSGTIALRKIPVYLKNGTRKIEVNALLDDASTKTYINSDVAELWPTGMIVCQCPKWSY